MSISFPIFKKNFQLGLDNFSISSWLLSNTKSLHEQKNPYYQTDTEDIHAGMLSGFFEGWPNPPDKQTHLRILRGSSHIVLALNAERDRVIGFITAISDGVSAAYIPHLEVLPEHRGNGIGSSLVTRMFEELNGIYMIDLMCDANVVPFYEKLGMSRSSGMVFRNYENQSGLPIEREQQHW